MKDFLLICDKNCATYKEVFPLFKRGIVSFGSPVKEYEGTDRKFGNHSWITTFSVLNKKKLVLTATYDPDKYPKYDNYNAIEVSRIKDIPYDYDCVMGVPITIFDYDLDNVAIEGCADADNVPYGWSGMTKEFVDLYYSQGNTGSYKEGNRLTHYIKDGKAIIPYKRVLIKKKIVIMGEEVIHHNDTKINGKERHRRVCIRLTRRKQL
jgi:hypothetical protein